MLRVALVLLSLSFAGCTSCRARPAPARPAPAASTAVASTPPPPPAPTAHDLVLDGEVSPTGPLVADAVVAEARSALAPLRECARMMPIDTRFAVRFQIHDDGAVRDLSLEGTLAPPVEECVRRVARTVRFSVATPGGDPTLRVPMRAIERPDGVAVDPSLACEAADECVFVTGDCTRPFVVHRLHAQNLDRLRRQFLDGQSCRRVAPTQGYEAVCHRGMCTDRDLDVADVACSSDAQCTAVALGGGAFTPANKARAADVAARRRGHVATAEDAAPAASCRYGSCLLRWSGGR